MSSTRQSSSIIALNMVKLNSEQRTFVIKTFYETNTLQGLATDSRSFWIDQLCIINVFQFPTVEECDFDRRFLFDEYVAISHCYGLRKVS